MAQRRSSWPPPQRAAFGNVLLGMLLVARGRRDGIAQFGATTQAFLASLAPLIAFPLVGGALALTGGHPLDALTDLLATACALLAPPVLSWEVARFWRREDHWLRFATAFNWCQWLLPLLGVVLMLLLGMASTLGLSPRAGGMLLVLCLGAYGLWLHWFLARHALQLSGPRAALLVLVVNVGTVLLVLGPRLLAWNRG
jgi:hypothetical protein